MAATSFCISRGLSFASCLSRGLSKISKWICSRLLTAVSLCWDLEHLRFCQCPLRAESLFPVALQLSWTWALLVSKARNFVSFTSWCTTPWLRSPTQGSDPFFLVEERPLRLWYSFHLWVTDPGGVSPDYTMSPPLLPISLWFRLYFFSYGKSFLLVFRSFS